MNLQEFIEKNAGKEAGVDVFVYDTVPLYTRFYESNIAEICFKYPRPYFIFCQRVDVRDFNCPEGKMVGFYRWLEQTFFLDFEKAMIKKLKTEEMESKNG